MTSPVHAEAELERAPDGSGQHAPASEHLTRQLEAELVARIKSRDESAATQLYYALSPAVERALRRLLKGDDADLDDLLQVTFERLIDTLVGGSYRGACSLRTWAVSIATNVAMENLRSRYRERNILRWVSLVKTEVTSPGPMQARLEVEELQATLSGMKPKLVHTLLLHDVFGHNLNEIASMEDASLAAVQSRLVRGRKELLRRIGPRRGQA